MNMDMALVRKRMRRTVFGRLGLSLLAVLYGLVVRVRNLLYRFHLLPSWKLRVRTICIGNLTTGGTGKTSAVLLAAQTLHKNEIKAAILTRGYKRLNPGNEVRVLLNTQNVSWEETGDEPWVMHRALKGCEVPILIHPNRYRAGETALTYYNPQVLLLDDGFQHRRLRRDLDVVLLNARDPFGGGAMLPSGDLREPVSELRRADLAVLTHSDLVPKERLQEIRGQINAVAPELEILESVHRADFLLDLKGNRRRRLNYLKDQPIACFSAIGDPDSFEELLRRSGAKIVQAWRFPDHHPFTAAEMRSIDNVRNGVPVVTTLKDFPRLPKGWQETLSGDVLALSVKLEITKGKQIWEQKILNVPPSDN